jgi:DNA (cytosine-5)-methyltransferase 1
MALMPRKDGYAFKLRSNKGMALPVIQQTLIPVSASLPIVVSLFSGAGGLDYGFREQGFDIPLALDISEAAIKTHKRNFPNSHGVAVDLITLGPDGVHEYVSKTVPAGTHIGVIGGPPCQGFSRANTNSTYDDPRNTLPALYIKIVRRLQLSYIVDFVVFENVLGIRDKKHASTYSDLLGGLRACGFIVSEKELCALDFGVPQNRKRIVLTAMRDGQGFGTVKPKSRKGLRTVREAIGNLSESVFFKRGIDPRQIPTHQNHWTMRPKSPKFFNPQLGGGNGRSFKRTSWDKPSRTIAFGHREIHIHPNGHRRLSIYEAMLLQGFPDTFILEGTLSEQVEQVSNAVPPPLASSLACAIKDSLSG